MRNSMEETFSSSFITRTRLRRLFVGNCGRDSKCWVLELEAVANDQIVLLGTVLPKVLLDLSRGLGLNIGDLGA